VHINTQQEWVGSLLCQHYSWKLPKLYLVTSRWAFHDTRDW